jgi:4-hydroxybenzoate polyprenyltransferase
MAKIADIIRLFRIKHYVKNGFVFLPLFFGMKLLDPASLLRTFIAFGVFSFAASGVYIVNDLIDRADDRDHPAKRNRPIASGAVTETLAVAIAILLFLSAFAVSYVFLDVSVLVVIVIYAVLNFLYTWMLKHVAVLDVCALSANYVLRVFAGSMAIGVKLSHWLVLMTFLLALFLALGKRKDDIAILRKTGKRTRKAAAGYSDSFLNAAITLAAGVVIVFYVQYAVSPEIIAQFGTDRLYYTVVFVIIGILRYLQQILVFKRSSDPTELFLKDRMIQVCVVCWLASVGALIYI